MDNILNKYDEITNNKLIIALFMFVFVIPNGMLEMTYSFLPMFKIRILFGLLIALKLCIKLKDKKKFPPMLLVGIIYCFGRFIRTYIATGILKTSLFDYSALITLPLIMLVESNIDNNAKNFIHGVLIYVETIIVLGGGCVLIPKFGSLFTDTSILGFDNYHFAYYSIALPIAYLNYYINKNKFTLANMIVLYIVIVLLSIKCWSATNLVAIFVFFITLLISKYTKITNIVSYIIAYFASFVGIIMFNLQYLFSFLVVDVLHKSLTFSGRVRVWDEFKSKITEAPIFGIGYQQETLWFSSKGKSKGRYLYAHNHILQELFNGGIIMYLIYIWFVIFPAKKLYEHKDNEISKALSSAIFAILIHSLCESITVSIFIFIYTISYHVDKYIELESELQ